MRKCLLASVFALLALAAIFPMQAAVAADKAVLPHEVVATVGDAKITSRDLEELLERYVPQGGYHAAMQVSQKEKYRAEALNELIEIELLYKEAKRRKIPVSGETVEAVVKANAKRLGSEEKLKSDLKKQGMTMEDLREKINKYQMVLGLLKQLYESIAMTEADLRAYYDKNVSSYRRPDAMRLFHILIKADVSDHESVWQEKKKIAEELLAKIKAGEDFGEIAYKHSEDPYRVKYGDMGLVHKGQLTPPELEEAAFALKEGEVSGVIRTIYGFHILKAGEKKPAETLPFDKVKGRVKKDQEQKKYDAARKELLEGLRREFPVAILISLPPKDGEAEEGEKKGAK